MNTVTVTGRAVREIEMRYTPSGKEVASGTIAVQRNFKNAQGEYEADFLDFVCWGKKAVVLVDYVKKGDHFGISGALQTRTYENQEGRKVKVTEINVESFDLPVKGKTSSGEQKTNTGQNGAFPFGVREGSHGVSGDPFADVGTEVDPDDLPF